jgi:dihydrofolate reductase
VIALVVARSSNGVIGRDGGLPWRLPTDLRHFRELTLGHAVLMGRRTFASLPDAYRPLPGRRNLVLSGRGGFQAPGGEVFATLDAALEACGHDCFVIGGGVTYRATLPLAARVYATEIEAEVEGDTFFPVLSPQEWRAVQRSESLHENGQSFSFRVYERAV